MSNPDYKKENIQRNNLNKIRENQSLNFKNSFLE